MKLLAGKVFLTFSGGAEMEQLGLNELKLPAQNPSESLAIFVM